VPLRPEVPYEAALRLVDHVAAVASLGIGRPVRVSGGVSVKHRLADEPPTYRAILGATQTGTLAPPAPLPAELLTMETDSRVLRVIRWWARGLAADDGVDRLVALNNALDLLAGQFDGASGRVRRCRSCGAEEPIGPGLRERVIHLLVDILGYPEERASEVYESRLDLAHARTSLDAADLRRYRERGTGGDRGAQGSRDNPRRHAAAGADFPAIDLPSALLNVEYHEGEGQPGAATGSTDRTREVRRRRRKTKRRRR
jgi:hypothetical protein